jgi:hypothetical protein
MTGRTPRTLIALGSILAMMAGTACKKSTPTTPDPVETTDTFTGTISPGGKASHPFTVNYSFGATNAFFTVTSLKSVADGSDKTHTIGVGYGLINVGVCTLDSLLTNPTVPFNQEVPTTSFPFLNFTYCIQIFDNSAAPTVTEPLTYTLKLRHF